MPGGVYAWMMLCAFDLTLLGLPGRQMDSGTIPQSSPSTEPVANMMPQEHQPTSSSQQQVSRSALSIESLCGQWGLGLW